jgi:hypothetical protein
MGQDEKALIRRTVAGEAGEVGPEDLSANLIVQLGVAIEDLNRAWYERKYRARHRRGPVAGQAPGHPPDGGDPLRHGDGDRGDLAGEIHVAVVVLGRRGRGEVHGPIPAQHHHRGRQMGRARLRLTRSTSTSCSPPRRSSGAVCQFGDKGGLGGAASRKIVGGRQLWSLRSSARRWRRLNSRPVCSIRTADIAAGTSPCALGSQASKK